MNRNSMFDLSTAIETHLQEIDRNQLLHHDEWEELFDHFLEETTALSDQGLSEKEALTVAKLRFGETAIIRQEYEQIRPLARFRKMAITGLMVIFCALIMDPFIDSMSFISYFGGLYFGIAAKWIGLFDLGLKLLTAGGFILYFQRRVKRKPYFKPMELWLLPLLGLLSQTAFANLFGIAFLRYEANHAAIQLFQKIMTQSHIIYFVLLIGLAFFSYVLVAKEQKSLKSDFV